MHKSLWIILTFLSGAVLPIQAGLNARLAKATLNPIYASLISFVVGMVALLLYAIATRQSISWVGLREAPLQVWLGGLLGAVYVTVIVLAFPRLGPGLTFGLVVAGQMLISILLEHYNVLVAQPSPISFMKVVGVLLVIVGVVIIRKY